MTVRKLFVGIFFLSNLHSVKCSVKHCITLKLCLYIKYDFLQSLKQAEEIGLEKKLKEKHRGVSIFGCLSSGLNKLLVRVNGG